MLIQKEKLQLQKTLDMQRLIIFIDKVRLIIELYYDETGISTMRSKGQYGLGLEYSENNQIFRVFYLNAEGEPTKNLDGYIMVERTFDNNEKIWHEYYYDENIIIALKNGQ